MNRYVVRSLVGVSTFCLGVAVGLGPRRPRPKYRDHCGRGVFKLDNRREYSPEFTPGPFLSIDTALADPLKLTYGSTAPDVAATDRQKVEFLISTNSKKPISNYTLSYRSGWDPARITNVFVRRDGRSNNLESVSVECELRQSLAVWISSVEYKDGTRWENPRHRTGQANL
jgi:hypothetical protein